MVRGKGTVTVPFYNLPAWSRGSPLTVPNQLQPFRNQLRSKQTYVQPMNQLFFDTSAIQVQAPHGVRIDTTPQVVDDKGITTQGPLIGGGRSFTNWSVILNATGDSTFTGTVSGTAIARLHHIFG